MRDSFLSPIPRVRPIRRRPAEVRASHRHGVVLVLLIVCSLSGCAWVRGIVSDPKVESHRLTERAREAADSENFDRAAELLERAGKLTPDDPDVHRELAKTLLAQGKRRDAIEALSHAVENDPDDMTSRVELARLLIDEDLPELAAEPLNRAIEIDPHNVDALLLRAKLSEQSGKQDVALETYHRVLSCDGEQVDARLALARLQASTGKWERATPLLRAICECPRSTPEQKANAKWSLGIAYGRNQLWQDAAKELTESAEVRTDLTADDWYRLAYARMNAEDLEGAWMAMAKALQKNQRHEPALAMSAYFQNNGWGDSRTMPRPIVAASFTATGLSAPEGW
ncbi:MAG: tetratricopeptide repeat protein [Planctomycetaceae bacterium]